MSPHNNVRSIRIPYGIPYGIPYTRSIQLVRFEGFTLLVSVLRAKTLVPALSEVTLPTPFQHRFLKTTSSYKLYTVSKMTKRTKSMYQVP